MPSTSDFPRRSLRYTERNHTRRGLLLPLLVSLAACGSDQAANETPNVAGQAADTMSHEMGPFFQAEMLMKERMMNAVGTDTGDNWVRKMIEHHRGAVAISVIFLRQKPSGDVAAIAQSAVDKQTKEIADLGKLVQNGQPDHQSASLYQPAMVKMHDALMEVQDTNVSETFMRKMLEHHRGAVAMSDVLLQQGDVSSEIRRKAQKTKSDQQKEIQALKGMLRTGPREVPEQSAARPLRRW